MGEPSPLRNPLGTRGSACVEVMTTLHGSTPSPWRRAEGCVPSEGTIASARDPLTHPFYLIEPPNLVVILFMVSFGVLRDRNVTRFSLGSTFISELEIDWSRFQRSQDEMSYDSLPPTPTTQLASDIVEMGDLIDMVFFMMGLRWTCWIQLEWALCYPRVDSKRGCMVDRLRWKPILEPTNVDQLKKYYV
ncbi:hypothetical protein CK203_064205 [Vitis vinifera]|uniref:Uncharacterized protein n=1 Tax=Vitis vinifera TaxID=29760 RepID=A0A438G708_VITVI|nr:hypothetical protein CK203_064205 [Vitis vinifera]